MNEAIIANHAQAHKLITKGLGLRAIEKQCTIDAELERRYSDNEYREYKVPVTIVQKGYSMVKAYNPQAAAEVVRVCAALSDGLKDSLFQTEYVGTPLEVETQESLGFGRGFLVARSVCVIECDWPSTINKEFAGIVPKPRANYSVAILILSFNFVEQSLCSGSAVAACIFFGFWCARNIASGRFSHNSQKRIRTNRSCQSQ